MPNTVPNPLLEIHFKIPFDHIRAEHVEPAVDELLTVAAQRLEETIAASDPLTALDTMTERLDFAVSITQHLEAVATTPQLRAAWNAVQPKITAFYASIPLNEELWKSLKAYATTDEAKRLSGARKRFLKKTMDSFKRAGADLDADGKKKLKAIDIALAEATTKFSENTLDATNAWDLVITDEAQLAGLPAAAKSMAREAAVNKFRAAAGAEAKEKGATEDDIAKAAEKAAKQPGWRLTLQAPSYIATMTYLDDAAIRQQVWQAYSQRAASGKFDNRELIKKILDLRRRKAQLLGFKDFADLVLDDRMAHTGGKAQEFLDDLRAKTQARFKEENAELEQFAGRQLHPWDVAYYAEKQRAKLYDFDEEALRPYFPLNQVTDGMFKIFGRILGFRVIETEDMPTWDPGVKTYELRDSSSGDHLGSFYADWFPRENKRGGAWMDSLLTGNVVEGKPNLGLICGNLTPPVEGKPALLTHREAETIFHEFGHLLHHLLTRVQVKSLAGTNVAWDWVELPSQIMENWCWEREALDEFARHWETGEPVPEELFQKMKRAKTFRAANAQMRQLGFGFVDLGLHRNWDEKKDGNAIAYSRKMLQQFAPAELPEDYSMITGFTHLFASPVGYGAGYYSYKWAEVLDADAFTRFQKEGVFSEAVGHDYRDKILAKGNSEDPAELYREFMGRDPDPKALLVRAGLA